MIYTGKKSVAEVKRLLFVAALVCMHLLSYAHTGQNESEYPALIPMPRSVQWSGESFDLSRCKGIVVKGDLKKETAYLQNELKQAEITLPVLQKASSPAGIIILEVTAAVPGANKEAYQLTVNKNNILLRANTAHGIFNGIQTMLQLTANKQSVQGCDIRDHPAYQWRGYMVDVGRNFQSVQQLKQQIDVMARYKLNIFHFHVTEDIAWRLQIKQYPLLTAPEVMERNKGKFYSIAEMKELIAYCRDRHITLVPEIDVPGHSKAFTRAMGVDMQSEEGTVIVKNIFEEICTTYDIPYLHIGADEVKITNPLFIPAITDIIKRHNKQVVAWAPGGNYDDTIIRQLWKDEGDKELTHHNIRYIDSKFLYISDFDPLNAVVTIFNRQLGGKQQGDAGLLGAEFCLWNDRAVSDETDLISKNPAYPAMLAFSERSWCGNGYPGVQFFIGNDDEQRAKDFKAFEKRLLTHKQKYFSQLPFVYVKQSNFKWKLFGSFENKGNLDASFWPENNNVHLADSNANVLATGGTVWLRHTHWPTVSAWLSSPKKNTTWYAYTRFWSNSDSSIQMWIDLKDLSRSGADATPPAGEWDYMHSKVWINKTPVAPPVWKHPGRVSGKLSEPMVDETYYYRPPFTVTTKKGWNEILLKLPVSTFDPLLDWQVPPKWMFTVVPVHKGSGMNLETDNRVFDPGEQKNAAISNR